MGTYKVRRPIKGMSGARFGSATAYTDFTSTGYQTMTKTGRVRKDLFFRADDFDVAHLGGSMTAGSMNVNITGSVFTEVSSSMLILRYFTPAVKTTGSASHTFVTFPVPKDADTTGSIACNLSWTVPTAQATTGSKTCFNAAIAYFGSGSTIRTAASTGACPSYTGTTALVWQEASLGNLPSFTASDKWATLVIKHDLADAGETIGGSSIRVSNVRLTYTANALGTVSTE